MPTELSLGGQVVYASGVVLVDEPESEALLSCLKVREVEKMSCHVHPNLFFIQPQHTYTHSYKSLIDDVGTGHGGGSREAEELSQLGTIQGMSCVCEYLWEYKDLNLGLWPHTFSCLSLFSLTHNHTRAQIHSPTRQQWKK